MSVSRPAGRGSVRGPAALGLAVTVGLFACGRSDGDGGSSGWDAIVESNGGQPQEPFEGHPVWLSESGELVLIQDCEAAERATAEGGPYGPIGWDDPGGQRSGLGFVCER